MQCLKLDQEIFIIFKVAMTFLKTDLREQEIEINLWFPLFMRPLVASCRCRAWGSNPQPRYIGAALQPAELPGQSCDFLLVFNSVKKDLKLDALSLPMYVNVDRHTNKCKIFLSLHLTFPFTRVSFTFTQGGCSLRSPHPQQDRGAERVVWIFAALFGSLFITTCCFSFSPLSFIEAFLFQLYSPQLWGGGSRVGIYFF